MFQKKRRGGFSLFFPFILYFLEEEEGRKEVEDGTHVKAISLLVHLPMRKRVK
jgi:hypothetical protein